MPQPSGHTPRGGLGRLVIGVIGFVLVAPVALVALPLTILLIVSRPRTWRELLLGGLAGGYALWWLALPGDLPDQLLRAAAVVTASVFVAFTIRTPSSFIHRAVAAVTTAAGGLYALGLAYGITWNEMRWWVTHRVSVSSRVMLGQLWATAAQQDGSGFRATLADFEAWITPVLQWVGNLYPALLALEILAGLGLAAAIYYRVAVTPHGRPLGRLRDFRFSEHLGWGAALPLVILLVPKLLAAKAVAQNLLLVTAVLYAVRGLAVAAFGLQLVGAGGLLLWLLIGVFVVLMLPVVLGGAIVLGVVDAGLDLRRRWVAPPTGE